MPIDILFKEYSLVSVALRIFDKRDRYIAESNPLQTVNKHLSQKSSSSSTKIADYPMKKCILLMKQ